MANKRYKINRGKIIFSTLAAAAIAMPTGLASAIGSSNAMPAPFVDQNFYNCVETQFKAEHPNETIAPSGLTDDQLSRITGDLSCSGEDVIGNLAGLEKLTGLAGTLELGFNQFTTLDISHNPNLRKVGAEHNPNLTTMIATNNPQLERIVIYDAPSLTNFNASGASALSELSLWHNGALANLDLSHNPNLTLLSIEVDPSLTFVDVSHNPKLNLLFADDILIRTSIFSDQIAGPRNIDLSGIKFIGDKGSEFYKNGIVNTDNYTFDAGTNLLAIKELDATNGYVQVTDQSGDERHAAYKLQLFEKPSGPVVPNTNETVGVPNTGTEGGLGTAETIAFFVIASVATLFTGLAIYVYKRKRLF